MNKRIEELAEQCFFTKDKYGLYWDENANADGIDLEKFAKLIVQECCNVLDRAQWDKGEEWFCADGTRIIVQVKEHFGVK